MKLSEIPVPLELSKSILLQNVLNDLTLSAIHEVSKLIQQQFKNIEELAEIADAISKFFTIRLKNRYLYVELAVSLYNIYGNQLRLFFGQSESFLFIRYLYDRKVFSLDDIMKLPHKSLLYFLNEINESTSFALNQNFNFDERALRANNWQLYKEILQNTCPLDSLENILIEDDLEKLKEIATGDFDFNQKIQRNVIGQFMNKSIIATSAFFAATKCFKFLLEKGCKITSGVCEEAVKGGDIEIIELCLANGGNFTCCQKYAIQYHRNNVFNWLVEHNFKDMIELYECLLAKNYNAFLYFTNKNLDYNLRDSNGLAPLHIATVKTSEGTCTYLLKQNVSIDVRDKLQTTPLMYAAMKGFIDLAKKFLDYGADVNLFDKCGKTPLYYAAEKGYLDLVKLFIERGADPEIMTTDGISPIQVAETKERIEVVEYLNSISKKECRI